MSAQTKPLPKTQQRALSQLGKYGDMTVHSLVTPEIARTYRTLEKRGLIEVVRINEKMATRTYRLTDIGRDTLQQQHDPYQFDNLDDALNELVRINRYYDLPQFLADFHTSEEHADYHLVQMIMACIQQHVAEQA